jgi:hypothetical protein
MPAAACTGADGTPDIPFACECEESRREGRASLRLQVLDAGFALTARVTIRSVAGAILPIAKCQAKNCR